MPEPPLRSSIKPASIWQFARSTVSARDSSAGGAAALASCGSAVAPSGRRKPRRHTSLDAKAESNTRGGAWKQPAPRRVNGFAFGGGQRVSEPGGASGNQAFGCAARAVTILRCAASGTLRACHRSVATAALPVFICHFVAAL